MTPKKERDDRIVWLHESGHSIESLAEDFNLTPARIRQIVRLAREIKAAVPEVIEVPRALFKIEKGVPMPDRAYRCLYPFPEMEVDDTFFVPCKAAQQHAVRERIRSSANQWLRRVGLSGDRRFRAVEVDGGVRVGRVA